MSCSRGSSDPRCGRPRPSPLPAGGGEGTVVPRPSDPELVEGERSSLVLANPSVSEGARSSLVRSSGFTLLEVMVAVCLMAIGVVPLLVTHASTIRAFTRSKEITHASFIASSQIGILESQDREKEETVPEPGEGQDEIYPFIHWKSSVSSSEGDTLARADVSVQIAPEGVARPGNAAALSTYLVKLRFKEEEEEKK